MTGTQTELLAHAGGKGRVERREVESNVAKRIRKRVRRCYTTECSRAFDQDLFQVGEDSEPVLVQRVIAIEHWGDAVR